MGRNNDELLHPALHAHLLGKTVTPVAAQYSSSGISGIGKRENGDRRPETGDQIGIPRYGMLDNISQRHKDAVFKIALRFFGK